MLEFIVFGIVGVILGLRFTALKAAMLSVFVMAGCVLLAIALNSGFVSQLLAALFSIVAFNLGLFWGLSRDRGKAGVASRRVGSASSLG